MNGCPQGPVLLPAEASEFLSALVGFRRVPLALTVHEVGFFVFLRADAGHPGLGSAAHLSPTFAGYATREFRAIAPWLELATSRHCDARNVNKVLTEAASVDSKYSLAILPEPRWSEIIFVRSAAGLWRRLLLFLRHCQ